MPGPGNRDVHAAWGISRAQTSDRLSSARILPLCAKTHVHHDHARSADVRQCAVVFLRLFDRYSRAAQSGPRHVHVPQGRRPLAYSESAQFADGARRERRSQGGREEGVVTPAAGSSMTHAEELRIRTGESADVSALVGLINSAFVVEQIAIEGDRVDADKV